MDIWLFTNSHLCQFIEIVHKIFNWYMKMPNNCLLVLYKHIIQVENVGLKVCVCVGGGGGGTNIPLLPNQKRGGGGGGHMPPPPQPPLTTPVYDNVQFVS